MARVVITAALVLGASYVVSSQMRRKRGVVSPNIDAYKGKMRLPKALNPVCYDLDLSPDLKAATFRGKLSVTLEILEPTHDIVLNAACLTIDEKSVYLRLKSPRQVLWPSSVQLVPADEILIITFDQQLQPGEAILGLEYQGILNDQLRGFYGSSHDVNGEKKRMAVTQFESADARRCFPCWDEPAFKATFKLSLHVAADTVALSNMPVVEETRVGHNQKTVFFEESPKMSTYLFAVVVGELEYIEDTTEDGKKVRVYTTVGQVEQGRFALKVAIQSLSFYSKYFGTPYVLPKLDMVGIPDFAAGAMENYGLVTYREASLLVDEIHSTAANKQRVAVVVAHEIAHQWFGNLVTMEWWTHLWLNEGFATWVSYLALEHLFPEWNAWTQFVEVTGGAFKLDGLVQSHPIEVEVGNVREIDEIFDAISYKKGAAIIRMLQTYLGPETFQKGLATYIQRFSYKNAATEDLWAVLSEISGEPVREMMDSWTSQQGYPVIVVKSKDEGLEIEQYQFLSSGAQGSGEWVVPITICHGSYDSYSSFLVRGKTSTQSIPPSAIISDVPSEDIGLINNNSSDQNKDSLSWLKVNARQTGFYRVQYDEKLAGLLRSAISAKSLDATDRFGVLDDTYALCVACKQSLTDLLSLMEVYREETDHTVLRCLIDISYKVYQVINDGFPALISDFKAFISSLFGAAVKRLGWNPIPGETLLDSMLRGDLLEALVTFGNEDIILEFRRRFDEYLRDPETPELPADIRSAAYKAVMQGVTKSNMSGYDTLLRLYREADLSQEKNRILGKLGSSSEPAVILAALEFLRSPEVRNQDCIFILVGISWEGREAAWGWLKENWDSIWSEHGDSILINHFISIVSKFSSFEKAHEVKAFFAAHSHPAIDRTVNQTIESVCITAQWVTHVQKEDGVVQTVKQLAARAKELEVI